MREKSKEGEYSILHSNYKSYIISKEVKTNYMPFEITNFSFLGMWLPSSDETLRTSYSTALSFAQICEKEFGSSSIASLSLSRRTITRRLSDIVESGQSSWQFSLRIVDRKEYEWKTETYVRRQSSSRIKVLRNKYKSNQNIQEFTLTAACFVFNECWIYPCSS